MKTETLKKMSDNQLLNATKNLVINEKKLLAEILDHLYEVDRRKLYSELKYPSLFYYCVRELGYSEDQAYRRIRAMRLIEREPLIKEKVERGEMTLTNVNLLGNFLKENITIKPKDKQEIIQKVSNCSKGECEKRLLQLQESNASHPFTKKKTIQRQESSTTSRLNITLDDKTIEKLKRIQGEHKNRGKDLDQIIDLLCENYLQEQEEKRGPKRRSRKQEGRGRYIPKAVKAEVYRRAESKCEHCGSTYQLEIDHRKPISLGGKSELSNLQLLCRNCNQRKGIRDLGIKTMTKYHQKAMPFFALVPEKNVSIQ